MIKKYTEYFKTNENTKVAQYEIEIKNGDKVIDQSIITKEIAVKIQDILDDSRGTQPLDATKKLVDEPVGLNEASQQLTVEQLKDSVQRVLSQDHILFGNEVNGVDGHARKELCFNVANTSHPYRIKIYAGESKESINEIETYDATSAVKNYNSIDLAKYRKSKKTSGPNENTIEEVKSIIRSEKGRISRDRIKSKVQKYFVSVTDEIFDKLYDEIA